MSHDCITFSGVPDNPNPMMVGTQQVVPKCMTIGLAEKTFNAVWTSVVHMMRTLSETYHWEVVLGKAEGMFLHASNFRNLQRVKVILGQVSPI